MQETCHSSIDQSVKDYSGKNAASIANLLGKMFKKLDNDEKNIIRNNIIFMKINMLIDVNYMKHRV
jgi:hypothetical protein